MRGSCGTQTQIISVRASLAPAAGTEAGLGQRSTTTFADGARYSIYTMQALQIDITFWLRKQPNKS